MTKTPPNRAEKKSARFIFVTGGVVSSLGKGIAAASLGALLESSGYSVLLRKLDPYLNLDPGTMNPLEHGEVFVTDDGGETDMDLGHYERYTNVRLTKEDCITSGRVYLDLLNDERTGHYMGRTIQVVPHVTDGIKRFIANGVEEKGADFVICEIGGTVGDIEAFPFLEAIRQFAYDQGRDKVLFLHLTLVPYLKASQELKTKPTQHSVRELRAAGISADIIMCRSEQLLDESYKQKIAIMCNVRPSAVISAPDVESTIYETPLNYRRENLDTEVLRHFGMLEKTKKPNIDHWREVVSAIQSAEGEVTIAMIGKYDGLEESYKSLVEAVTHAGIANRVKVNLRWVSSEALESQDAAQVLQGVHGIIVLPGFGQRGIEGKIKSVNYARTRKIPFLGICLGMQVAIIEYARSVMGLEGANSTEFNANAKHPLIIKMSEWVSKNKIEKRGKDDPLGGTMRLGSYPCDLRDGSLLHKVYDSKHINERHRHRFEVNSDYVARFEKAGLLFSGMSQAGKLPEACELKDHPWFVGVQFHPEFKSRPFSAHPLFCSFIDASIKVERLI